MGLRERLAQAQTERANPVLTSQAPGEATEKAAQGQESLFEAGMSPPLHPPPWAQDRGEPLGPDHAPGRWKSGIVGREDANTLQLQVQAGPFVLATITRLSAAWGCALADVLEEALVLGCERLGEQG